MTQEMTALMDIIDNFNENYNEEIISEYPTNFSNDTLLIIREIKNIAANNSNDIFKKTYENFLTKILKYNDVLKEHFEFDFNSIKSVDELATNEAILAVEPSFTHYDFVEVEGIIEQMLDEMKNIKDSQAELKEELEYILEDYLYHIEYIEENIQYNYYIYDGLEISDNEKALEATIAALKEAKLLLHDKFQQKLNSKK